MRRACLALGVFLLACTAEQLPRADAVDAAGDAIVNGQPATGDPAVVALTYQGQAFCSATLITPSVVVTAAHCLPPFNPVPASQIGVLFGTGPQVDEVIEVHDVWAHPDWSNDTFPDDVGLLQMKAVAKAAPVPLNTTELASNTSVRMVGFGITGTNETDSGVKREGTGRIEGVDAAIYYIGNNPSATCSGDSGGPTFVTTANGDALAGIHSRSDCWFQSLDTRVDAYLAEIQDFIDGHPDPSCDADGLCATPCAAVDPDCPCAEDGHCTTACSTPTEDPDCDDACIPDGTCVPNCGFPDPDCPTCGPDGACVPGCFTPDPDCTPAEPECDPSTSCCDESCSDADDPLALDEGGCGCRLAGSGDDFRSMGWLALVMAARLRRRTRGTRRARPAPR